MFANKVEVDDFGKNQKRYFLTQGDSCSIISVPKDDEGRTVDFTLISQCKFKIMDKKTFYIEFEKVMPLEQNVGGYIFNFLATESVALKPAVHRYEIEYTLEDGGVNTTNSYFFEILPQGRENQ